MQSKLNCFSSFCLRLAFFFRYNVNLREAKAVGIKKGITTGVSLGTVFLIMFSTYGLAFWYGSELIFSGEMDLGTMLTTFFSILIGAFSLGGVSITWTIDALIKHFILFNFWTKISAALFQIVVCFVVESF